MEDLTIFENWLAKHLPEVVKDLHPPATLEEVQLLEKTIGRSLPEDFILLYQWHNGQMGNAATGPWYGLEFMPIKKIIKSIELEKQIMEELGEDELNSMSEWMKSTPDGYVKKANSNPFWVPFAHDHGGNFLGIDLDPDKLGTIGQVINFGRDEERKIVASESVSDFLSWLVKELGNSNFNIAIEDDEDRSLNMLTPESGHFLDALAKIYPEQK
ncbi:SMI1/KNR4 family protein [Psychrobacter sp. DAB_AL43B]|uniref:SMI1/KNR4 family protein n=1 Tax=Psychrobacter sp. DAB_AL43B TaxID=1028416 RepID=UPI0009A84E09|nr:SMI1/KNR4 family protein [Psychrobacter sp. DAB_AL43B]SLJ85647.1 hypothetical protein DABAL43B_2463 [Psychrobacter sp. DAB_AL43B]